MKKARRCRKSRRDRWARDSRVGAASWSVDPGSLSRSAAAFRATHQPRTRAAWSHARPIPEEV